jgi:hypothetical protein
VVRLQQAHSPAIVSVHRLEIGAQQRIRTVDAMAFHTTVSTVERPPMKATPTKTTPIKPTPLRQTPIKPIR